MAEYTPRNRYLAQLLSQGMDTSPIASPYQGLSRMAFALLAGKEMGDDERQSKEALTTILDVLGKGQSPTAVAPAQPANQLATVLTRPTDVNADAVTEAKTPQGYINRGFGMSPTDREVATRTVLGEAANQGQGGMNAVADVIRNRADNGGYGGRSMSAVALAPNQFEPHNTAAGRQRMASFSNQSPQYKGAQEAVDSAGVGSRPDATGGAHYFYAPKAQAALAPVDGRPVTPSFAAGREPTAVIGDHNFYAPQTQVAQQAPQQAPQRAAQAQPTGQRPGMTDPQMEQLRRLEEAGKKNPYVQKFATGLVQGIATDRFKKPEYDIQVKDGITYWTNKNNPQDRGTIDDPEIARVMIQREAAKKYAETTATKTAERDVVRPDRDRSERRQAFIVIDKLNEAEKAVRGESTMSPATGLTGQAMANVGGTRAADLYETLKTVKSATSIQQLNEMRQSSPTGGALGNVTEGEHALLQSVFSSLEQRQSQAQFLRNLGIARQVYMDIINGTSVVIPRDTSGRPMIDANNKVVAPQQGPSGQTKSGVSWSIE
jgi:spore germination cell wall hydrolase CwlJ-like protein